MNVESTKEHWKNSAGSYDSRIVSDLDDPCMRKAWTKIITENMPDGSGLRILDVGTGPGFFSIILSEAGHRVTGIDCTEDMIRKARKNAEYWKATADFQVMDAEKPDYPADTFDLILSRNVTWTLLDPFRTYKEWKRILKPGGRIMIFDGNWYWNLFDRETFEEMERRNQQYQKKFGQYPEHFSMDTASDYMRSLPLVGIRRPDWDKATLWKLGYTGIQARWLSEEETARSEKDRLLYGAVQMFMILADKTKEETKPEAPIVHLWEM